MSKTSKSTKVNLILIAAGFVLTAYLVATQINNGSNENSEKAENQQVEKIEIPAKIAGRTEQMITHIGYTVSYNSDWKTPNWVAYELTKEEVEGIVPRYNAFLPDPEVSYENSATTYDYSNSGWDRGHMAPAADMKWSEQAMKESFFLSNICPQNSNLNRGIWNDLEEQVRKLAQQKGKIYVVCGPIISKQPKTIGTNKVAIPDAFFKVLLQNTNDNWYAIAFLFANKSGRKLLSTYAMSVEDLQIITDIDFFPALPDDIEQKAESEVDFTKWNITNEQPPKTQSKAQKNKM
ncbi:MAG: DNA/RNA non-specific endonuclease [Candidatus Symbiothrix sp.]|jgi:endonuclease G|nr:DNA/RNA non-specific endonuclease [Candidatus Symbiothrix sp.]